MSLKSCPQCDASISIRATSCPKCSEPNPFGKARCVECEALISKDVTTCPECGEPDPFTQKEKITEESIPTDNMVTSVQNTDKVKTEVAKGISKQNIGQKAESISTSALHNSFKEKEESMAKKEVTCAHCGSKNFKKTFLGGAGKVGAIAVIVLSGLGSLPVLLTG